MIYEVNALKRDLYIKNQYFGTVGTYTKEKDVRGKKLYVGDVVTFKEYGSIYTKVVNSRFIIPTIYGIYGFGSSHLNFEGITKVAHHTELTDKIFKELQSGRKF